MSGPSPRPEVLALLHEAKERPEADGPRLVLADLLDDHGDPARADFIRWQCRLAPQACPTLPEEERRRHRQLARELVGRFGGAWAGPLWRWGGSEQDWHRGLGSFDLRRRLGVAHLEDVLPWIDTAFVDAWSTQGLERVVPLLNASTFNHVILEVRRPLPEEAILACLAKVRENACLRSLTLWWQTHFVGRERERARLEGPIRLGDLFFARLRSGLPLGRHLTHFGSRQPLTESSVAALREGHIQLVPAWPWRWQHGLPPSVFARKRPVP
jgi:uncharacterized protein (TIGR02996 family)